MHLDKISPEAYDERRRSQRIRTVLGAVAWGDELQERWPCTVHNVSITGARLELDRAVPLPPSFQLDVPDRNVRQRAVVVWRTAGMVGVRFGNDSSGPRRIRSETGSPTSSQ